MSATLIKYDPERGPVCECCDRPLRDLIGKRVRLIRMNEDPAPVEPGTIGTVRSVDDAGTIHMNWDNGRTLGLIPGVDSWTEEE